MDLGQCPRCAHPYSTSEVVGFGILRARAASAGGPRVEYACPECDTIVHLIPYGEGRYAPPGEPPPAAVAKAERRPPWASEGASKGASEGATGGPPPDPRRAPAAANGTPPEPPPEPPPTAPPESARKAEPDPDPETERESASQGEEVSMGPAEALELLGIRPSAEASEIDRAFRVLSLTCHPDKAAHLDKDFQDLAERKFKRLLKAYEILSS